MVENEEKDNNIPDQAQFGEFEENTTGATGGPVAENDSADDFCQMLYDAKKDYESEKEVTKFERMLTDHKMFLYPGCEQGIKSQVICWNSYNRRQKNGVTDKAFCELLKLIKNILPEGNKWPETTYEANRQSALQDLKYRSDTRISNDYILCRGEDYENLETCPVCMALQYKIRRDDSGDVDG